MSEKTKVHFFDINVIIFQRVLYKCINLLIKTYNIYELGLA